MKKTIKRMYRSLLLIIVSIGLLGACSKTNKNAQTNTNTQAVQSSQKATSQNEQAAEDNQQPKQQKIKAPDFTLTRINGKKFTLSNHFGKVIVLNIWATWCPPCRHEIPDFVKMQKELKSKGVLFVGVSVDQKGVDKVRSFAKAHHMNYPVMVDNGTISQEYGPIKYVPTTFVIGRDGYIKGYQPGMLTAQILKPVLEKLAKKSGTKM